MPKLMSSSVYLNNMHSERKVFAAVGALNCTAMHSAAQVQFSEYKNDPGFGIHILTFFSTNDFYFGRDIDQHIAKRRGARLVLC